MRDHVRWIEGDDRGDAPRPLAHPQDSLRVSDRTWRGSRCRRGNFGLIPRAVRACSGYGCVGVVTGGARLRECATSARHAEHDIFVSYAHGVAVGNVAPLRTWSHCLVDELKAAILNTAQRVRARSPSASTATADPTLGLTADLKAKVEESAILLIVMSPFYVEFELVPRRGRLVPGATPGARARRWLLLRRARAMPTDGKDWPRHLKDEREHPLVGIPVLSSPGDDFARPFGWHHPLGRQSQALAVLRAAREPVGRRWMRRLSELRGHRRQLAQQSQRFMGGFVPRAVSICRPGRITRRLGKRYATTLRLAPSRSGPIRPCCRRCERRDRPADRRLAECSECDAVLILRAAPGDWINQEIGAARIDRAISGRTLQGMPFLVLDRVGGDLPTAERSSCR